MRKLALVLVAASLAACGGDDRGPAPEKADTTPAVNPVVGQLRDLCARTTRGGISVEAYRSFVSGLKKLDAPEQIAAQERMLPGVTSAALAREAFGSDDAADARMGAIDCVQPASATGAALKSAEQICADNRARTARARSLAGEAQDAIDGGSSERLARLVVAAPRPPDDSPEYGGWTDSLKTASNLYRLASGTSDDTRAKALRDQAVRTAAAARKTAAKLGLAECAKP